MQSLHNYDIYPVYNKQVIRMSKLVFLNLFFSQGAL